MPNFTASRPRALCLVPLLGVLLTACQNPFKVHVDPDHFAPKYSAPKPADSAGLSTTRLDQLQPSPPSPALDLRPTSQPPITQAERNHWQESLEAMRPELGENKVVRPRPSR